MEKLWTTAEVAGFLGIAESDVEELVRQGTLTGYKLGGQFLRFRPDQVTALKGQLPPRLRRGPIARPRREEAIRRLRELVYFYDFYVVSAALLAVVIVYLLTSG